MKKLGVCTTEHTGLARQQECVREGVSGRGHSGAAKVRDEWSASAFNSINTPGQQSRQGCVTQAACRLDGVSQGKRGPANRQSLIAKPAAPLPTQRSNVVGRAIRSCR